jgi:hypothetical protein
MNFIEFKKKWDALPEPRQCFVDLNGVPCCWTGDSNKFGDCPGRSFGFENVFLALTTPEERKVLRRQIEDRLRKSPRALGTALALRY